MRNYVEPTLSSKLETLILDCGTNDPGNGNVENRANKIIALAVEVKKKVPNFAVSGILFRTDMEIDNRRKEVN